MTQYTVVISDAADHDSGFRGTRSFWWLARHFGAYAELGLYWFLREYFGSSSVTLVRPSQLLSRSSTLKTDVLFVGLPTSLSEAHLKHVDFGRMVMYDSTDWHGVNFGESDKSFLFSHTNTCLKNWRDHRLNYDQCSIGLLPIKRPPLNNKMHAAVRLTSAKQRLGMKAEKQYDVGFVARPTGDLSKNQRIRWLVDLKSQRPDLKLWGGLVGGQTWKEFIADSCELQVLESCWLNQRKVGFFQYFAGLCQSKVSLAPAGYAPWTYRHFEAIYARSVVVSNDLRHHEFLIPFPREGMVEVADGGSIVDGIEAALDLYQRSPGIVEENVVHLNRWLDAGSYSRKRPETLDRFMAQLDHV